METIPSLVKRAQAGYFAAELEELLHVFIHNAVGKLYKLGLLRREQIGGQYLYLSPILAQSQFLAREKILTQGSAELNPASEHLMDFLSVLNEKQKRLYLGLESIRHGHGGDVHMAMLSGVNVKTVSRGRRELLSKAIDTGRIRREGAGRPPLKKTK